MSNSMFTIRVPATTANLGPGFDSIGMALALYMTVEVSSASEWSVTYEGDEYDGLPTGENNLIVETIQNVAAQYGKKSTPLALLVRSDIPLGKGMGSSATAIAAGIEIANHAFSLEMTPMDKVRVGSEAEGHADNVSAALLGGVTISYFVEEEMALVHLPDPQVGAVVLVPPKALSTEESRGLLPEALSHAAATAVSAAGNVLAAAIARNDWETAGRMMEKDLFHEPYRKTLFPHFNEIRLASHQLGAYGMTISGAGPSLFIAVKAGSEQAVAAALQEQFAYYSCLAIAPSSLGAEVYATAK